MNGKVMWLVCRYPEQLPDWDWPNERWEIQGLYEDESEAVGRCETIDWFIMPLTVGQFVPTETIQNEGAYYPLAPKE